MVSGYVRPYLAVGGYLRGMRGAVLLALSQAKRIGDALARQIFLSGDALGVDLEQHCHAVSGPFRDLRWCYTSVEPRRHARVPEVVCAPGQRRGVFLISQCFLSGSAPGAAVGALRELAGVADSPEQVAVGVRAEPA